MRIEIRSASEEQKRCKNVRELFDSLCKWSHSRCDKRKDR